MASEIKTAMKAAGFAQIERPATPERACNTCRQNSGAHWDELAWSDAPRDSFCKNRGFWRFRQQVTD